MANINKIELNEQVSTVGVNDLNFNFEILNQEKGEKIENLEEKTEIELLDYFKIFDNKANGVEKEKKIAFSNLLKYLKDNINIGNGKSPIIESVGGAITEGIYKLSFVHKNSVDSNKNDSDINTEDTYKIIFNTIDNSFFILKINSTYLYNSFNKNIFKITKINKDGILETEKVFSVNIEDGNSGFFNTTLSLINDNGLYLKYKNNKTTIIFTCDLYIDPNSTSGIRRTSDEAFNTGFIEIDTANLSVLKTKFIPNKYIGRGSRIDYINDKGYLLSGNIGSSEGYRISTLDEDFNIIGNVRVPSGNNLVRVLTERIEEKNFFYFIFLDSTSSLVLVKTDSTFGSPLSKKILFNNWTGTDYKLSSYSLYGIFLYNGYIYIPQYGGFWKLKTDFSENKIFESIYEAPAGGFNNNQIGNISFNVGDFIYNINNIGDNEYKTINILKTDKNTLKTEGIMMQTLNSEKVGLKNNFNQNNYRIDSLSENLLFLKTKNGITNRTKANVFIFNLNKIFTLKDNILVSEGNTFRIKKINETEIQKFTLKKALRIPDEQTNTFRFGSKIETINSPYSISIEQNNEEANNTFILGNTEVLKLNK